MVGVYKQTPIIYKENPVAVTVKSDAKVCPGAFNRAFKPAERPIFHWIRPMGRKSSVRHGVQICSVDLCPSCIKFLEYWPGSTVRSVKNNAQRRLKFIALP